MSKLYVIKDVVADVIQSGPFVAVNDGVVLRQFMDLLNGRSPHCENYRANPADFELYFIGTMDDKTGELSPERPVMMHRLSSLIQPKSEESA